MERFQSWDLSAEKAKKAIEFIIERSKIANPFKEKFSVSKLSAILICGKMVRR